MESTKEKVVSLPVNGVIDLHTFSTREIFSLMDEYIRECVSRGIFQIRIIHGKGKGLKRAIVHKLLEMNPHVESYGTDPGFSGWGATVAYLRVKDEQ